MLIVIHPWYEAKLFIEHSTNIEHGTLHLVVGFLAWLAISLIWRLPLWSWKPWLAVLTLILWNEVVDLGVERWPHPGMQYGEGVADLFLTMLVPTVTLLAVRYRPALFVQAGVPFASGPDGLIVRGEGADAMETQPDQPALFQIEGPDEDGCVWACSPDGRDVWCRNLGPTDKAVEVMSQWLGTIDADEAA